MEQGLNVVNKGVFEVDSGWLELEGDLRGKAQKAVMKPVDLQED